MSEKEQYFGLEKKRYVTRGISELLPDEVVDRRNIVEKILQFYNINSTDELYEYTEIIETGSTEVKYSETLYLLVNGEKSILIFCAFE